jgi:stringent starvation protein B
MNNEYVQLSTRFSGMPIDIYLPVGAVMGIYTQENGQGMVFEPENPEDEPPPPPPKGPKPVLTAAEKAVKNPPKPPASGKPKPSLRVVK